MNSFESNEKVSIPIEVSFSLEDEILRIKNTIKKYEWFVENRYNPDLPAEIKNKLEKREEVTEEDIKIATEKEYSGDKYQPKADEIIKAWKVESADFLEKLKSLGRSLPEKYFVFITTYGVGGSYGYPDNIQLNINKVSKGGILHTIFHEMVHLAIEDLIKLHNIPHWTKERLVDLTMNKFFPNKPRLQKYPENAEKISDIFEREFPNIEKIIIEVSKI